MFQNTNKSESNAGRRKNSFSNTTSAILAAQIKKTMPNIELDNHASSISPSWRKIKEAVQQSKLKATLAQVGEGSERSHEGSAQAEELLIPETKEEAVDPEKIKMLPLPLREKKQLMKALTLPPSKVPLKDKIMEDAKYNYRDLSSKLTFWKQTLKDIEGFFGVEVVSYFHLLRWLLLMNCLMLILIVFFLVIPAVTLRPVTYKVPENFTIPSVQNVSLPKNVFGHLNLSSKVLQENMRFLPYSSIERISNRSKLTEKDIVKYCHKKYKKEIGEAKDKHFIANMQNLLQGTGWMESTMMFLGNYPIAAISSGGFVYNMPLAVILVFMIIYFICFVMMMRYCSEGAYEALMTQIVVSTRYANDIFAGWNYSIQNPRAAEIHHRNLTYNINSSLSEITYKKEAETRSRQERVTLYSIRGFVNVLTILWIAAGYYAIFYCVHMELRQENQPYKPGFKTWLVQFLPALSVTTVRLVSPFFFLFLARFEHFHPRTAMQFYLARITIVGLSSVFVLVASFKNQIICQPLDICGKGHHHCHAPMCWETYVGQELYKLNISEFLASLFFFGLFFAKVYAVKNWDNVVMRWICRVNFNIPQEICTLIYLQTITWLGMLYSPLLPAVLIIKLFILFYMKKATIKHTKHSTTVYKAFRSNTLYIILLVVSFLIVIAIQFYSMTRVFPSYACSPFRFYDRMSAALTDRLMEIPYLSVVCSLIFTKWIFLPVYLLQGFLIYFYTRQCSTLSMIETKLKGDLALLEEDKQCLLEKIAGIVNNEESETKKKEERE